MRLAHLHLTKPISYVRSLALQDALLHRHFDFKDSLRARRSLRSGVSGEPDQSRVDIKGPTNDPSGLVPAPFPNFVSKRTETTRTKRNLAPAPLETSTSTSTSSSSSSLSFAATTDNPGAEHSSPNPPDPTLITFSTTPTYTVGRRHLQTNPISPSQQAFLSASGAATFHASPRGGLLTYHAPGQLTGYVVADLRRHGISPRCWIQMLEDCVMHTCAAFGVRDTTRTDDPGVWIKGSDRKICAIGVQVSRGITSHGVGFNIFDHSIPPDMASTFAFTPTQIKSPSYSPLTKGFLSWGFSRVIACGLEGKSVTWLDREKGDQQTATNPTHIPHIADEFAVQISRHINRMRSNGKEEISAVYTISEADLGL
ncbi:lipoyl(octanoyl) transferase [Exophiala mesophila]|uniref:lipoyl(octanoyl) transferase n=1 Tax=Exophiala mesophila TaxID=212818 RepID=A0A0D1XLB2_EXOME|nr:lipoyl(octanoyl) transferase [Exophiala mesophila]KIV88971.1 lipoyl(octanoyl) transferase [Exophiala mesophila]